MHFAPCAVISTDQAYPPGITQFNAFSALPEFLLNLLDILKLTIMSKL
jgi:hypothetical protein